jgi:eukaryotic-like serine/threonine-protein kinase
MDAIRLGRVIAGRYRLEAPVARGGMGSVWKARHLQLDTAVAVKFINLDQRATSGGRARFEREAKAAALLHGPNVVEVYDYGVDDGLPYLVMELLQGEDLSRRIARERRLPVPSVVSLIGQVSRALRRAHEAGIVHRDLKPGNIFLVDRDDDEEPLVKVLDFGIARTPRLGLVGETTKTGTLLGSPRYMSPEQARAPRSVDPRSDLWSLAVIAFRTLTGTLPFVADEVAELLVKICTESASRPSSFDPELVDFDPFFEKAFARDPNDRFQTARELATELSIVAGQPPPSLRIAARTTGRSASFASRPTFTPDRGSTDLVAIAPIGAEASLAAPEPEAAPRATTPSSPENRETIPEGRRPAAISQETLTDASRSLDVVHETRSPAPRILRVWATAVLCALAGLVVGGSAALHLLSTPGPIVAASASSSPVVLAAEPSAADAAAEAPTDAAALEVPAASWSTSSALKRPRPALSAAPPIPSARSLPRGRPSSQLGI